MAPLSAQLTQIAVCTQAQMSMRPTLSTSAAFPNVQPLPVSGSKFQYVRLVAAPSCHATTAVTLSGWSLLDTLIAPSCATLWFDLFITELIALFYCTNERSANIEICFHSNVKS